MHFVVEASDVSAEKAGGLIVELARNGRHICGAQAEFRQKCRKRRSTCCSDQSRHIPIILLELVMQGELNRSPKGFTVFHRYVEWRKSRHIHTATLLNCKPIWEV